MSRRRRLSPEEQDLWDRIVASARPRRPAAAAKMMPAHPDDEVALPRKSRLAQTPFRIGELAPPGPSRHDLAVPLRDQPETQAIRMDRKAHRAMTRGRLDPEARIDLHGMTVAEAHPALTGFVLRAWKDGRRLVLVITGKGRSGTDHDAVPRRSGVLRHQVPHWLTMQPVAAAVLHVAAAHARHGGEGAYYVYLRRAPG